MIKLNAKGQKILKIVHLFFVALWVGGNISAVLLSFMTLPNYGVQQLPLQT